MTDPSWPHLQLGSTRASHHWFAPIFSTTKHHKSQITVGKSNHQSLRQISILYILPRVLYLMVLTAPSSPPFFICLSAKDPCSPCLEQHLPHVAQSEEMSIADKPHLSSNCSDWDVAQQFRVLRVVSIGLQTQRKFHVTKNSEWLGQEKVKAGSAQEQIQT